MKCKTKAATKDAIQIKKKCKHISCKFETTRNQIVPTNDGGVVFRLPMSAAAATDAGS